MLLSEGVSLKMDHNEKLPPNFPFPPNFQSQLFSLNFSSIESNPSFV